jgi:hypothetical protein
MRSPHPVFAATVAFLVAVIASGIARRAEAQPYNPYADAQDVMAAPVAADGTLRWGTFYKSAAMQKTYERLWSLGACRGTNKAITVPVTRNRVVIDSLPEDSFSGRVRGAAGSLAGGMIAFTEGAGLAPADAVLVAQLHPAGVTRLEVAGRSSLSAVKPGMTIRVRATFDDKGRANDAVSVVEIVTPAPDFAPDAIRPHLRETAVGTVLHAKNGLLTVKVDAGRMRRLTVPVTTDAEVVIKDAAQFDLIAPGDEVRITGRRWSGEGCMSAGTVFASQVIVTKPADGPDAEPDSKPAAAVVRKAS